MKRGKSQTKKPVVTKAKQPKVKPPKQAKLAHRPKAQSGPLRALREIGNRRTFALRSTAPSWSDNATATVRSSSEAPARGRHEHEPSEVTAAPEDGKLEFRRQRELLAGETVRLDARHRAVPLESWQRAPDWRRLEEAVAQVEEAVSSFCTARSSSSAGAPPAASSATRCRRATSDAPRSAARWVRRKRATSSPTSRPMTSRKMVVSTSSALSIVRERYGRVRKKSYDMAATTAATTAGPLTTGGWRPPATTTTSASARLRVVQFVAERHERGRERESGRALRSHSRDTKSTNPRDQRMTPSQDPHGARSKGLSAPLPGVGNFDARRAPCEAAARGEGPGGDEAADPRSAWPAPRSSSAKGIGGGTCRRDRDPRGT